MILKNDKRHAQSSTAPRSRRAVDDSSVPIHPLRKSARQPPLRSASG
jgi:hypothetical protein